ncbi:hypothetical protein [Parasitella parasitica]|uniref:BHLH domain-containing protein n=1 Tax=Parasitella parasitica TaxID=35722 RepID=A0A0B7NAX3_9FUNG|nr:hypothetical protein [Parasitella parasitica]
MHIGSSSSLLSASSFSPAAVASNTCSTGGIKINALFISPTNDNDEKEFRQSNIVQKYRQSTPHSSPSSIACGESRLGPKLKASSKRKTVELLSDDQKRANHIASEQKRRANIRIGFEQLVATVPTLSHGHKSEALILQKSVEHLRGLVESKLALKERARKLQLMLGEIPDEDSSEGELDFDF